MKYFVLFEVIDMIQLMIYNKKFLKMREVLYAPTSASASVRVVYECKPSVWHTPLRVDVASRIPYSTLTLWLPHHLTSRFLPRMIY